jgi:hypothetical protein
MIDVDYPQLLTLFPEHLVRGRSESAAFLIWYLEHYYRLDTQEAVDAVCDQKGDRGVDGIFVDDNAQTITIFQSRISQRSDRTAGDAVLRELAGTVAQFHTADGIKEFIASAGNAQVGALVQRLQLLDKIATHSLRGELLTNINIDHNGLDYLNSVLHISFTGKETLLSTYVSETRDIPDHPSITFDIHGLPVAEWVVDTNTKALVVPIKAVELVGMTGIADQSLFAYNVRGPLGRTQVNKDIVGSIADKGRHKEFPLFHNGVTVIARDVVSDADTLTTSGYYVVNGCQSLTALFDSKRFLTDDLRVLVKFIKADPKSALAQRVTQFSNNQNGVRPRDFKSNSPIQIRLLNEMDTLYGSQYYYEIKRGDEPGFGDKISNEDAGLYLRAFDLKEPWTTHRKYEVFEDKHSDLFGRPSTTADRIVMLHVIMEVVDKAIPKIENQLIGRYALARYLILYVVRDILESDGILNTISADPGKFVRDKIARENFRACVELIVDDIIGDLNDELKTVEENFDYRGKLRDQAWVQSLSRRIVADHRKLVSRNLMPSFKEEWEKRSGA